jgi:hypothetical protein
MLWRILAHSTSPQLLQNVFRYVYSFTAIHFSLLAARHFILVKSLICESYTLFDESMSFASAHTTLLCNKEHIYYLLRVPRSIIVC